jgi:hypothetical protein
MVEEKFQSSGEQGEDKCAGWLGGGGGTGRAYCAVTGSL